MIIFSKRKSMNFYFICIRISEADQRRCLKQDRTGSKLNIKLTQSEFGSFKKSVNN